MAYKIEDIEGIGPATAEKLAKVDIQTTDDLIKLCAEKKGREDTSEKTGCSTAQLLKWTNMADLMRISGIGGEYSELLEAAGVDTVKELKNRNAANLAEAMAKTNAEKKLTRTVPSEATVQKWIDQAKELPGVISY